MSKPLIILNPDDLVEALITLADKESEPTKSDCLKDLADAFRRLKLNQLPACKAAANIRIFKPKDYLI